MVERLVGAAPWQELSALIAAGEGRAVRAYMDALAPLDTVRVVSHLDDEERRSLLLLLEPEDAADVLEHIPESQASEALESIDPESAARILEELPSNEQADLLNELEDEGAEAILAEMEAEDARELRELATYGEDTAGGLMITEFVPVPAGARVEQVIDQLRASAEEYLLYDLQHAYVLDEHLRLLGLLRLRDLLFAPRGQRVDELMIREPDAVRVEQGVHELEHFFDEHRHLSAPVLDARGRLLGVLQRAAVEEAVAEEGEETFRHTQGIVGGEELRSMPTLVRTRRRMAWLSVNIGLNVAAASIIAAYQDTLQAVIALAVFLPIISDMSGCSGNQAVAVSLRELTLGVARPADVLRVLRQELRVGLLNGLALGLLIALVAWAWKGNPWLAAVVGLALALNTLVAVCIGGVVPLVLARLRRDPALAAGPILTTITDMCGFFLVLSLASLLLARLS